MRVTVIGAGPADWRDETTGELRPAVEAYLRGEPMTTAHIAALRRICGKWINAPAWDRNPYLTNPKIAELNALRDAIDGLTSREAFDRWLDDAFDQLDLDPL